MSALARLAAACGIEPCFWDVEGRRRDAQPESIRAILAAMGRPADDEAAAAASLAALEDERRQDLLPPVMVVREGERPPGALPDDRRCIWTLVEESGRRHEGTALQTLPDTLPCGYHRLDVACGAREGAMSLIVVPQRCHLPESVSTGGRPWGIAVHLYTLRSAPHWGAGDLGDLARLGRWAAQAGAATLAINPLHALSLRDPGAASPYFPSSRLFVNPAYLDIPALPEFARSETARRIVSESSPLLDGLRAESLTDHRAVAALKSRLLEAIFHDFRLRDEAGEGADFAAFRQRGGGRLESFATFEALAEHFATPVWREWPAAFHAPLSAAVAGFGQDNRVQVAYRAFVQWLCARQLAATRTAMKADGLSLGLYGDMALGVDPMGADAWIDQPVYSDLAQLGAPPDDLGPAGQAWGIAAPLPEALYRAAYAPFIAAVRANMAQADILRIDHVMALQRCFWIPRGMSPKEGAYVRYPLSDLLGIVALESRRAGTVVIGEDLGTVDPELRRALADADAFSMRLLYFEKEGEHFRPPGGWPRRAVASVGTHDLPPLKGFWQGRDISTRQRLGLDAGADEAGRAEQRRQRNREGLLRALDLAGLPVSAPYAPDALLRRAIHRFLARTQSWLALVQLDDLTEETDPINLPGTVSEYPNWRRKLSLTLEEILSDERLAEELAEFATERAAGEGSHH